MILYLKQFYESPMGLLSIVVSEEGLVELDFYDPKEEAPDPYGALEQVHPYHEKVKEWLDHYFAGNQLSTSTARDSFSRAGVAVIARDPIW